MINLILWSVISIVNFIRAYKIKNNDKYEKSNLKDFTIKDNGEVVTYLGSYNSKLGYLRFSYITSIISGCGAFFYGIIYNRITGIELLAFLGFLALVDFIVYRICKTI